MTGNKRPAKFILECRPRIPLDSHTTSILSTAIMYMPSSIIAQGFLSSAGLYPTITSTAMFVPMSGAMELPAFASSLPTSIPSVISFAVTGNATMRPNSAWGDDHSVPVSTSSTATITFGVTAQTPTRSVSASSNGHDAPVSTITFGATAVSGPMPPSSPHTLAPAIPTSVPLSAGNLEWADHDWQTASSAIPVTLRFGVTTNLAQTPASSSSVISFGVTTASPASSMDATTISFAVTTDPTTRKIVHLATMSADSATVTDITSDSWETDRASVTTIVTFGVTTSNPAQVTGNMEFNPDHHAPSDCGKMSPCYPSNAESSSWSADSPTQDEAMVTMIPSGAGPLPTALSRRWLSAFDPRNKTGESGKFRVQRRVSGKPCAGSIQSSPGVSLAVVTPSTTTPLTMTTMVQKTVRSPISSPRLAQHFRSPRTIRVMRV